MNYIAVPLAVGMMAALGSILAIVLAIASRRFFVYEDPRITQVEELLPGSNCGACGQPGCHAFAELAVAGQVAPGNCTVSSEEAREAIADVLGVDVGGDEKIVARLACAGGTNVARQRAAYAGMSTCRGANLVAGGGKGCAWGCLGLGDCEVVCDFDAITMNPFGIPEVDEALCTACGDCVDICPKHLFTLEPVSHRLWVACRNEAFGDEAEDECAVACTACGKCVADAPENVIEIRNNLAVVNYAERHGAARDSIERCPTGAIVWLTPGRQSLKGRQARRIVRQSALPVG